MKIDKSNTRRRKSSSVKPKGKSTTKSNSNIAKLKKENHFQNWTVVSTCR